MTERIVLRKAHLNVDPFEDRITGSDCRVEADRWTCADYQIELGTKEGDFLPVFSRPVRSDRDRPRPGDTVFHSPEFYLEGVVGDERLGKPLDLKVRAPRPSRFLGTEELIREVCLKQYGGTDLFLNCHRAAHSHPEDFDVQQAAEDPFWIYFEEPPEAEEDASMPPFDARYLVKGGADLVHRREEKPIAPPEPVRREGVREGALAPFDADLLIARLRGLRVSRNSTLMIGTEKILAKTTIPRELQGQEKEAQEILGYLARTPLSPPQVFSLLEILLRNGMQVPVVGLKPQSRPIFQYFDEATLTQAARILEAHFRDPRNLAPMVAHLRRAAATNGWQMRRDAELNLIVPALANLLLGAEEAHLPSLEDLAWLSGELGIRTLPGGMSFKSATLLAAARRLESGPSESPNGFEGILSDLAKSPRAKDRLAAALAAGAVAKEKTLPYIGGLLKDGDEEVRTAAYQTLNQVALRFLLPARGGPDSLEDIRRVESEKLFKAGLEDGSEAIRVLCARHLGGTSRDIGVLTGLLEREKDEAALVLAAGGLAFLMGRDAVSVLLERLKRPAPESLFLLTLDVVRKTKAKDAGPLVYGLLLHDSPRVRESALGVLRSFDAETTLKALLKDSENAAPSVRRRAAEALGNFEDLRAAQRIVKLSRDADESVEREALNAIVRLRDSEDEKVKGFVARAIQRDPTLQRKLNPPLAAN